MGLYFWLAHLPHCSFSREGGAGFRAPGFGVEGLEFRGLEFLVRGLGFRV